MVPRAIAVRRANALARLAIDQAGKPEGINAKTRLQEQILKYELTTDDFDFTLSAGLRAIGVVLQNKFADWRSWRPQTPPPPPPPRYEVNHKFTGEGPYSHDGVCKECKVPFTRRSPKQGNPPLFCSDACHTAWRREQSRIRMAKKRASGYAG